MEKAVSVVKDNRSFRTKPWLVRWYGEYDVQTGKQRRYCKSFILRKDADLFAEEKTAEFQNGTSRDHRDITLGQLCDKFMSTRKGYLAVSSRHGYDDTIGQLKNHFAPTIFVRQIRTEDAEEFIAHIKPADTIRRPKGKPLADSSRDRHLRQAKKIFSTALTWGYIRMNPFKGITLGKIRKKPWHFITVDQFNGLIAHTHSIYDRAFYGLMYWCGLRFGEAINLLWDGRNIDFENGQINICNRPGTKDIPPFNVKDYEARSVPMNRWVTDILKTLQSQTDPNCPFVLLTPSRYKTILARWQRMRQAGQGRDWENRFMLNGAGRNFKGRCRVAGIKTDSKLSLHILRKSWATNLANSGKVPAHTLKQLGGWSNIRTCEEFYLQSSDANKQKACDVLNGLAENGQ